MFIGFFLFFVVPDNRRLIIKQGRHKSKKAWRRIMGVVKKEITIALFVENDCFFELGFDESNLSRITLSFKKVSYD